MTEPTDLLRHQDTGTPCERRPDLAVGGVDAQGRLLLLDVTTTDPSCKSNLSKFKTASVQGAAAAGAEAAKEASYSDWVDPAIQSFMPVALELPGRWGPSARRFFGQVKAIAVGKRDFSRQRHSLWAGFWKRAISIGFQRDLAQSALRIRSQLTPSSARMPRAHLDLGRV